MTDELLQLGESAVPLFNYDGQDFSLEFENCLKGRRGVEVQNNAFAFLAELLKGFHGRNLRKMASGLVERILWGAGFDEAANAKAFELFTLALNGEHGATCQHQAIDAVIGMMCNDKHSLHERVFELISPVLDKPKGRNRLFKSIALTIQQGAFKSDGLVSWIEANMHRLGEDARKSAINDAVSVFFGWAGKSFLPRDDQNERLSILKNRMRAHLAASANPVADLRKAVAQARAAR